MSDLEAEPLHRLRDDLVQEAPRWHIVAAIRALMAVRPEAPAVGSVARPAEEAIRFSASPSLAFPNADLASVQPEAGPDGRLRYRVTSRFLSLLGASCVLPQAYTERLTVDSQQAALARAFVDLLHHRVHALAFRVFERSRPFDDRRHPLFARGAHLAGLARLEGLEPRIAEQAGLLAGAQRSGKALQQIISGYFGLSCRLQPMLRTPLPVPEEQRSRLGRQAHRLRGGAMLGRRRSQPRRSFGLRLGPMAAGRAAALRPGGDEHRALRSLIDHFNRDALHCQVTLAIGGDSVPVARLDRDSRLGRSRRLGGRAADSYDSRFVIDPDREDQP